MQKIEGNMGTYTPPWEGLCIQVNGVWCKHFNVKTSETAGLEEPDKRICKNTIDQGRKRSLQASKYSKTVYENLNDS